MAFAAICTPKGYENLAQGLPWVWGFNATRPHKALHRSAFLEKHPVRRVGGAEGAPESNRVDGKNTRAGVSRYTVYARPTSFQPMNVAP
jgi:hypothetical protein